MFQILRIYYNYTRFSRAPEINEIWLDFRYNVSPAAGLGRSFIVDGGRRHRTQNA